MPFACEASHRRNADERQGCDEEAPHGDRHKTTDPAKFTDPSFAQLVDKDTGTEEEAALRCSVGSDVKQSSPQPFKAEQRQTEINVGYLADRGVCQSLFCDLLPESHHRAHEDREHAESHPRILDPGTPDEVGTH